MADLISRAAAIEALGDEPEVWAADYDYMIGEQNQWQRDVDAIRNLPSAERRGKWKREVLGNTSSHDTTIMYQCSVCERMSISKYYYCPNCGARMED